jgi:hypothetical protein
VTVANATAAGDGQAQVSSEAAAPAPGEFVVVVHAREDSWISLVADGQTVFQDILTASSEKTVHAQKTLVMRAGNVGDLDISFNGNKLPVQGESGEAKTLTFGAGGLVAQTGSQLPN